VVRGRSPFKADKEHLHHVLMMAGLTVSETVMALTAVAVGGAAIGITGEVLGVPDLVMLAGFVLAGGLYLYVILRAWTVMRFLRWSICRRRAMGDRRVHAEQRREQRGPPANLGERRGGRDRRNGDRRNRAPELSARAGAHAPRSQSSPVLDEPNAGSAADAFAGGGHERARRHQG